MDRMRILVPPPCCLRRAAENRSWWPGQKTVWCTLSIRIKTAKSSGRPALGKAARWAECCGESPGHNGVAYVPLSDIDRRSRNPAEECSHLMRPPAKSYGTLRRPNLLSGKPGCTAAQLAPPSLIEGVVFAGSMDGHLRAYEMACGKIIWDFDATQTFPTTDGIKANGGSFSSTGPTLQDGMLYVNSGYGGQGMAGNVLLAFSAR